MIGVYHVNYGEIIEFRLIDVIRAGNETDDHYWVSAHLYGEALEKASQRFNVSKEKIRLEQGNL